MRKITLDVRTWFTRTLVDAQNTDKQKAILNILFNSNSTEESIELLNKVQAAFNAEMQERKADAIEEHRVIASYFREAIA